jgi:hypothetical protein
VGFPNVDKQLVRIIAAGFAAAKADPARMAFLIGDLFDDLTDAERTQITTYLTRKAIKTDVRDKKGDNVYIITSFPLLDIPFPQIAISLGVGESDRFMGDLTGESEPIKDDADNITGWCIEKGYYERSSWDTHVVCATKDEAIWLARLCQRFICEAFGQLSQLGINEVNIIVQDLRCEEGTMQPSTVFNRSIKLQATVSNTWNEMIPTIQIAEGDNLLLTQTT